MLSGEKQLRPRGVNVQPGKRKTMDSCAPLIRGFVGFCDCKVEVPMSILLKWTRSNAFVVSLERGRNRLRGCSNNCVPVA